MREFLSALGRGLARTARALGGFILRFLQVILRGLGDALVASVEAAFRGLGNLISRFFSSPFGLGVLVFLAGYGVFLSRDQKTGAILGLLGIIIAFFPLARKKSKK